jgi:hypothetical protein
MAEEREMKKGEKGSRVCRQREIEEREKKKGELVTGREKGREERKRKKRKKRRKRKEEREIF